MKVKIGQVGIANHGGTILDAIQSAENLQLVSVFDTNQTACEEAGRKFGVRVSTSFDELVRDLEIEAVALVTPNHLHAEQLHKAVEYKKHIFVEKPIANTISEAKEMIASARHAGLTLMVGHNTRRRRVFRRAEELLKRNAIGKVVAVEANLSRPAGLQPGLPAWKADPDKCALLPMMQLGIHFIDTVHYLFGPVEKVSCFAANIAMPGSVFDSTAAILQLKSSIPVTLSSYYVSADTYFLRVYGTEGTIHCSPVKLKLDLLESGELIESKEEDFSSEGAESFILEMREFGECITKGIQPETGGEVGLQALAVIEAMVRSVETRSVVDMNTILQS